MVPQRTRPKRRIFSILWIALLIVCLVTSIYALDFYCKKIFPDFNYRKYYSFYLREVVWRGLVINSITNVLFTREENLSTTKLPVWEIQLSGRKLAALSNDLPTSGRTYQSGTIVINSSSFPARFRFRGDGFWHWGSKQKSWKIQLKGGQRFEGKKEFNLVNPRCITTLVWPLTSYVANSMGLTTPRLQHVHARLNGQYLGLMYLVENFDHDFTSHHDLPEGALYEDEALGGPPFYNSWERIDDWKIRLPGEKKERQAGTNPEERYEERLRELLECARLKNDEEFFHKLEELVDVPHYLTWWAYTTFFLDTHQDRWHNNRFYFDPTSAKFLQIPWDMTILGNPMLKDTLDLNLNPITERLLQSPYYVHVRNKILWETLQGPVNSNAQMQWVDTAADLIRGDIYCDPHKDMVLPIFPLFKSLLSQKKTFSLCILPVTNEMFEGEVNAIKTFLKERAAFLGRILSEAHAELVFPSPSSSEAPIPEYYTSAGCVSIHVGGHTGIVVKEISIQFASPHVSKSVPFLFYGNRDELITRKGERVHSTLSNDGEVYSFNVDELLLPGRDKKPPFGPLQVRYPFAVVFAASAGALPIPLRAEVKGVHPFTNQEVFLEASLTELKDTRYSIPMGKFQSPPPLPRKILWSGVKKITQDFLVHKGEILIINPGTRVELTQGASVLSYGRVVAVGTATSPIVVTRGPQAISWGVVALQGSDASGSVFDHCIFEYGGDDELEGVFYSGALSIYNADATIRNCLFRFSRGDDALNTKFSTTDVMHSTFMDNTADAYDADFSDGLVAQNLFEKNGNDGIDCGTAHPTIRDNRILYSGDKGISIGERSHPVVEGNLLAHCNVGLAIKDQSQPVIRNNEFLSNRIAVSAYQKKKVFGGAQVEIYRSNFKNNKSVSESDAVSSVSLLNCVIDDGRSPQQ